jgi:hypothetical protein
MAKSSGEGLHAVPQQPNSIFSPEQVLEDHRQGHLIKVGICYVMLASLLVTSSTSSPPVLLAHLCAVCYVPAGLPLSTGRIHRLNSGLRTPAPVRREESQKCETSPVSKSVNNSEHNIPASA